MKNYILALFSLCSVSLLNADRIIRVIEEPVYTVYNMPRYRTYYNYRPMALRPIPVIIQPMIRQEIIYKRPLYKRTRVYDRPSNFRSGVIGFGFGALLGAALSR